MTRVEEVAARSGRDDRGLEGSRKDAKAQRTAGGGGLNPVSLSVGHAADVGTAWVRLPAAAGGSETRPERGTGRRPFRFGRSDGGKDGPDDRCEVCTILSGAWLGARVPATSTARMMKPHLYGLPRLTPHAPMIPFTQLTTAYRQLERPGQLRSVQV